MLTILEIQKKSDLKKAQEMIFSKSLTPFLKRKVKAEEKKLRKKKK